MLLTFEQGRELMEPHAGAIERWHRGAYEGRDETRRAVSTEWAAQDESTKGRWVNNLIVEQARSDQEELRNVVPLDGTDREVAQFTGGNGCHALGRFRRVEMLNPHTGAIEPIVPGPRTPKADRWINNEHHEDPFQFSLFPTTEGPAANSNSHPTHLVIGHTIDHGSGELEDIVVACFVHGNCYWWFELPSGESGSVSSTRGPMQPLQPRPRHSNIGIQPKQDLS